MIESIGVGFREQMQKEQKLTDKSRQLLSDIKIGDVLKGSLSKLENGQIVLISKDSKPIPVKLQGMAIFNENIALEVIKKEADQVLLKLLEGEGSLNSPLQGKIIKELGLPETDPMRQLIEAFLAKQVPLQREGLLKNYHMHQSFEIPMPVLANLSQQTGKSLSLQEAQGLYEAKQTSLEQIATELGEVISKVKDNELAKQIFGKLEKYLDQVVVKDILKDVFNENVNMPLEGEKEAAELQEQAECDMGQEEGQKKATEIPNEKSNEVLEEVVSSLKTEEWEKLGKAAKTLFLKAITVDLKKLQDNAEESRHIENSHKILTEILKTLEKAELPEKYEHTLKKLEATVQIVNKFNVQGEYYFFPLDLPQGKGKGELYFFKPKKRSNENKENLYVVLALELPRLSNVEVHMRQEKNSLLLHFKLKEQGVLNLLEAHLMDLKRIMGQTRFNLQEIKFSLLEEKNESTFLQPEAKELNHMDFKI